MLGTAEPADPARGDAARSPESVAWLAYVLLAVPVLGLAGVAIYSFAVAGAGVFATALLVAAAAFVAGGLLGFLFGIPRSVASEGATSQANTNLVEISDWLTKILVGLGLVELGNLVDQVGRLVDFLAPSLGDEPGSESFTLAILILFNVTGFLVFYLATRLYVGLAFARVERQIRGVEKEASTVLRGAERQLDERLDDFLQAAPTPPSEAQPTVSGDEVGAGNEVEGGG
jgi:hypothetical protein